MPTTGSDPRDALPDSREVNITHPGKLLFPEDGATKQGPINHYARIAPWMRLLRTGQPPASRRQTKNWLLIKHHDEYADPSWNIDAPRLSRSVVTGRTMKEIAWRTS